MAHAIPPTSDQTSAPAPAPDLWAHWLLHGRFGGDPAIEQMVRQDVQRFRDRVLDAAQLAPGMTLVDVGAGEGLVAFGALARIGPTLQVVLTDISPALLELCRHTAAQLGVQDQCRFLQGSAERLAGVADASADVVALRATLAYVPDKIAAFHEFFRVLRPRGRLSLAEPILQDEAFEACSLGKLIAAQPGHKDIDFLRLLYKWKSAQYPVTEERIWHNPITNYSERDLVRFARHAGFVEIHVELHIDHRLSAIGDGGGGGAASWDAFVSISPHPGAPNLRQIMADRFTPEERSRLEQIMRPQVEGRRWISTDVVAYMTAVKPGPSTPAVR
jgi:arsenite methyltransferase